MGGDASSKPDIVIMASGFTQWLTTCYRKNSDLIMMTSQTEHWEYWVLSTFPWHRPSVLECPWPLPLTFALDLDLGSLDLSNNSGHECHVIGQSPGWEQIDDVTVVTPFRSTIPAAALHPVIPASFPSWSRFCVAGKPADYNIVSEMCVEFCLIVCGWWVLTHD